MKKSKRQLKAIIRSAVKASILKEARYRGKNYRSKQVLDDMTYGDSGPTEFYKPSDPIRGPGNIYKSIRSRESAMSHARAQVRHVIQALGLDPRRATFHPETRKMGELERAMNTYGYMIDYDPSAMTITFENKSDTSDPYVLDVSHLAR